MSADRNMLGWVVTVGHGVVMTAHAGLQGTVVAVDTEVDDDLPYLVFFGTRRAMDHADHGDALEWFSEDELTFVECPAGYT